MTAEHAHAAAYRAVHSALTANTEKWGQKVASLQQPPNTAGQYGRPYVVITFVASTQLRWTNQPDAMVTLYVQAVADNLTDAVSMAGRIDELLDNSGAQDGVDSRQTKPVTLNGGTNWTIQNCTRRDGISLVENIEGARQIYREGAKYELKMERV